MILLFGIQMLMQWLGRIERDEKRKKRQIQIQRPEKMQKKNKGSKDKEKQIVKQDLR